MCRVGTATCTEGTWNGRCCLIDGLLTRGCGAVTSQALHICTLGAVWEVYNQMICVYNHFSCDLFIYLYIYQQYSARTGEWGDCTLEASWSVDCVWNVMAHAQKTDFVLRRNGRVHLNWRGHQFSRLLAAEVCASAVVMLYTPCFEVVWRVLTNHSIRQFPFRFPSRESPCAITFQLDSTTHQILSEPLTFRHRASCILGQAFRYSLENAFYIFNQQLYFIIWYLLDRASLI